MDSSILPFPASLDAKVIEKIPEQNKKRIKARFIVYNIL